MLRCLSVSCAGESSWHVRAKRICGSQLARTDFNRPRVGFARARHWVCFVAQRLTKSRCSCWFVVRYRRSPRACAEGPRRAGGDALRSRSTACGLPADPDSSDRSSSSRRPSPLGSFGFLRSDCGCGTASTARAAGRRGGGAAAGRNSRPGSSSWWSDAKLCCRRGRGAGSRRSTVPLLCCRRIVGELGSWRVDADALRGSSCERSSSNRCCCRRGPLAAGCSLRRAGCGGLRTGRRSL